MKYGLVRYLWPAQGGVGGDPGLVQQYLRRKFEAITVGYVPALDQLQIACWDANDVCRMCIRYQWSARSGLWSYEVVPGFFYLEPESECEDA